MTTISDVIKSLNTNLDYFGDPDKCLKLIHAINYLTVHRPINSNLAGNSMSYNELQTLKKEVINHLRSFDTGFSSAKLTY